MDWHHHQGEQEERGKPALQVVWTLVWAPRASRYARCQHPPGTARGHCYVPGGQARSPMQLSPSWAGAATAMSLLTPPSSFWPAKLPAEAPGRPPALTPRRQQPPLHHRKDHIHTQEYFRFSPSYLAEMPQVGFVLCFLKVTEGETDQDAGLCPRCRRQ